MRLEPGMVVKTNYGTGPYRLTEVIRGCTCPAYLDEIEMDDPPSSSPHLHLICQRLGAHPRESPCYLNGYDEETLKSIWNEDYLIVINAGMPVQRTMF